MDFHFDHELSGLVFQLLLMHIENHFLYTPKIFQKIICYRLIAYHLKIN